MSENTTPKRRVLATTPLRSLEEVEARSQHTVDDNAAQPTDTSNDAEVQQVASHEPPPHEHADDQWWVESTPYETEPPAPEETASPAETPVATPVGEATDVDAPEVSAEAVEVEQTAAAVEAEQTVAATDMAIGDAVEEGVAVVEEPVVAEAVVVEDAAVVAAAPKGTEPLADLNEDELEGTRHLAGPAAPELKSHRSIQGLTAAARRDVGRVRKSNQDSVFSMLTTLPRYGVDIPVGLFIVADGMGGHDGGEIASRLAVRGVVFHILDQLVLPALDESMPEELQQLMITAVQEANKDIWDQAQTMGSDMGTTCTAVLLLGHSLFMAHVGDSRAYLLVDGKLNLITTDHSTVGRLIQMGQISPAEAREHPLRNQLYRTVGQQAGVQVDFIYQHTGEATHLLICSDGLWGMLREEFIVRALTSHVWAQDACDELIALANLAGGEDNISAVVVTLPLGERPT